MVYYFGTYPERSGRLGQQKEVEYNVIMNTKENKKKYYLKYNKNTTSNFLKMDSIPYVYEHIIHIHVLPLLYMY